ncbi:MAG: hypothetical protein RLZZ337_1367 [Bacteroidota bacterium]|jgi:hypothetical protein
MKFNKLLIVALAVFGFTACEEYEKEMVLGHELAGEWFMQTYVGGNVVLGYQHVFTYNTAAADGKEIWFDDYGHIWPVKAKIAANPGSNSFAGTGDNIEVPMYTYDTLDVIRDENIDPIDSVDQIFAGYETVTIKEGKIIPGGGKSRTGVVVDSIYVLAEFSDDPGTEYEFSGHRRTGFLEDDF